MYKSGLDMKNLTRSEWGVVVGLLLLSFIPSFGIARLVELSLGMNILPANPRVQSEPIPVIFHITSSIVYCIFGIFQFLPTMRQVYPMWHKTSGRVLVIAGIVSAFSGLWMTQYYSFPVSLQGDLLYFIRITVSYLMIIFILLGLLSILKKRVSQHKSWMVRAYAIGQGAGTQSLIFLCWMIMFDEPNGVTRDVLMTSAWVVNLALAEWFIKGGKLKSTDRAKANYSPV